VATDTIVMIEPDVSGRRGIFVVRVCRLVHCVSHPLSGSGSFSESDFAQLSDKVQQNE
jgi:hypothetical protein